MKKLYVGNLPFQATEQDISNWINQAGATVATVSLVTDRETGQPRGFGFVEINNDEEAARVIQSLNGQDFMGRKVVVNEARPREGGGRGRGDGGEGRGRLRRQSWSRPWWTWPRALTKAFASRGLCLYLCLCV